VSQIEELPEFLDRIAQLDVSQLAAPAAPAVSPAARAAGAAQDPRRVLSAARDYILSRYTNVEVANTFADAAGQPIDCIRVNQQPALRGAGAPDAPPAFVEMPGVQPPAYQAAVAPLGEDQTDQFGNQAYCPPGYVPVLRVTPELISRAGGLDQFFQKAPGGGRHPSFGSGSRTGVQTAGGPGSAVPFQVVGGAVHAYAHASLYVAGIPGGPCIGARSWLNLWTPLPAPGVFSLSQQWIAGGSGSGLQTIEGGWHVYPNLYNDTQLVTRLFLFWTADGYATTGSYNLANRPGQGGFIQTDNTWVLGGSFPVSTAGGDQRGFAMQWQRDPANGNWWLFLQGSGNPVAVGYYPAALYGGGALSQAAQSVDFGGEVCGQPGGNQTGQMGSGQDSAAGWQAAAFQKEIAYLTSAGWVPATLTPDQRDAPAYTIDLHNNSGTAWGTYFFFGGAGGQFP
jgi:hypothetical protein